MATGDHPSCRFPTTRHVSLFVRSGLGATRAVSAARWITGLPCLVRYLSIRPAPSASLHPRREGTTASTTNRPVDVLYPDTIAT